MYFLPFILKNLIRRRARSGLTVIGVGVAVGAVVALLGVSNGFENSFSDLYRTRGVDLMVVQAGKVDRLTSLIDEKIGDRLRQLPGVKGVTAGMIDFITFEDSNLVGVPLQGWEHDSAMFNDLKIQSGRGFQTGDQRAVMLGMILARNLGKRVGDTVELYGFPFQVVGIYESFNIFENGSAVVLLEELQDLLNQPDKVSGFQILVEDSTDAAAIDRLRQQIDGLGAGVSAMATEDFVKSTTQIRVARGMTWWTSAIALIIGVIGVLNTMIMSVMERTREIGILRAIGWRKVRVVRMIMSESITLCLIGAVVGTLGAMLVLRILSLFPASSGFVQGDIPLSVMAQGLAIAVAVGLLGGAYPAFRGAQLLPTEALRHE